MKYVISIRLCEVKSYFVYVCSADMFFATGCLYNALLDIVTCAFYFIEFLI